MELCRLISEQSVTSKQMSKNPVPEHPYPQGQGRQLWSTAESCSKMQPADQAGLFLSHQNKTHSDQELLMKLLICACSARHCESQTLEGGTAYTVSGCWGDPWLPCRPQPL